MKKALLTLAIAISLLSCAAWAGVTKAIQFAPGKSSATISGSVIRGERDVYTLRARAGQSMDVHIKSAENNAVFQIYRPGKGDNGLPKAGDGDDAMQWSGKLPSSGDYRVVVGGTRGNASYTLTVSIK